HFAGLVVCARCGCRLSVHYDDGGARLHTYECVERWTHYGEPRCQHLAGPCLDTFVSQQVLAALEPAALELSLTATERVEQERAELDRMWQQRRERAAYEVERAARQYQAVEPEHRLVARTLEHAWEEKLAAQQQLEEEYHRFVHQKPRLRIARLNERPFVAWRPISPRFGLLPPPQMPSAKRFCGRSSSESSSMCRVKPSRCGCGSSGSVATRPR